MRKILCLLSALFIPGAFLQAQTYTVSDLGGLDGTYSFVSSLSAKGRVVGYADTPENTLSHAVLFNGKGIGNTDLGAVGGSVGTGMGINASGVIVGRSYTTGDLNYRATRFTGNGSGNTDLGTLGGISSTATAINAAGIIVGDANREDGSRHATRFSEGGNTDLGTLGGIYSIATAINSTGTIVGSADLANGTTRAVKFGKTKSRNKDLGTLGGTTSVANGINASGVIIGSAEIARSRISHATRFSGTGTGNIDLGTLGGFISYAYGINSSGIIVGQSTIPFEDGGGFHAFIYQKGKMIDLNSLVQARTGLVLTDARAINDKGQIACNGSLNGANHAFLLDPVDKTPTFKITATADPSGKGSVRGGGTYKKGRTINLTATAKNGAKFVKWTENGKTVSTKKVYSFKVTKARKLVAHFRKSGGN